MEGLHPLTGLVPPHCKSLLRLRLELHIASLTEPRGRDARNPGLDAAIAALADPTHRAILAQLMKGEATVQDFARPVAISQTAISRHLKVLAGAGLIDTRIDGTARLRKLNRETVPTM